MFSLFFLLVQIRPLSRSCQRSEFFQFYHFTFVMKITLALLMPTIVFGFQDFTVSLHLPASMTLEFLRARITTFLIKYNINIEIISRFAEMLYLRFVHSSSKFVLLAFVFLLYYSCEP